MRCCAGSTGRTGRVSATRTVRTAWAGRPPRRSNWRESGWRRFFPPGGTVVFTGGATEAINLALRGTETRGSTGDEGRIAFSAIEHSAVGDTARALGQHHTLDVDENGQCRVEQDLPGDTRLVAVMQVNNEIGAIQPTAGVASPREGGERRCFCATRSKPMARSR